MAVNTQVQAPGMEFGLRKERSLWTDAWRRLSKNKAAVAGLIVIALLTLVSIFANFLAPHPELAIVPNNGYRQPFWVETNNPRTTGKIEYPLGTDTLGRDMLTKLLYGGRVSLIVGLVPTLMVLTVGSTIGLFAGFSSRRVDNFVMRITDVVFAFPDLLFTIIIMTAFRETPIGQLLGGLPLLFIALSIVGWPGTTRLVRGQVLSLKEKEFIEAARAIGVSRRKIMWRHLFPNVLGPLIVSLSFGIPAAIIGEAALGFLGVGLRPPTPGTPTPFPTTWGVLLQEAYGSLNAARWNMVFSAGIIALITLAFVALGDGLQDALDPRRQK